MTDFIVNLGHGNENSGGTTDDATNLPDLGVDQRNESRKATTIVFRNPPDHSVDEGNENRSATVVGSNNPPDLSIDQGNENRASYSFDPVGSLTISVTAKLRNLVEFGTFDDAVFFSRVPEKNRNNNEKSYTPRSVSIGFIHHGESRLQAMEEQKFHYLHHFTRTFRVNIEQLSRYVCEKEQYVRGCYEKVFIRQIWLRQSKVSPSEVTLLDGIFIIELFLRNHFPTLREGWDDIFENPWVSNDILHDLLLFENQLPLKFLNGLYDRFVSNALKETLDDASIIPPSFHALAHNYFRNVGHTGKRPLTFNFNLARHLVEFLSILHMPKELEELEGESKAPKVSSFMKFPTATALKAAGVKFRPGAGKLASMVNFNKETGELTIPPMTVNDVTETFFRNMLAFEQTTYYCRYITSYAILLDDLINTPKDVDILISSGVIKNELRSNEQVAEIFKDFYNEFVSDSKDLYFGEQCRQLNEYSRDWWHKIVSKVKKYYATLRREYLKGPWKTIALLAAIAILILTVAQTWLSALQLQRTH